MSNAACVARTCVARVMRACTDPRRERTRRTAARSRPRIRPRARCRSWAPGRDDDTRSPPSGAAGRAGPPLPLARPGAVRIPRGAALSLCVRVRGFLLARGELVPVVRSAGSGQAPSRSGGRRSRRGPPPARAPRRPARPADSAPVLRAPRRLAGAPKRARFLASLVVRASSARRRDAMRGYCWQNVLVARRVRVKPC